VLKERTVTCSIDAYPVKFSWLCDVKAIHIKLVGGIQVFLRFVNPNGHVAGVLDTADVNSRSDKRS